MAKPDLFSRKTVQFLAEARQQTSATWLDEHAREHEDHLVRPLRALALHLAEALRPNPLARGYRFPRTGFGRLRRPKNKVERGDPAYRGWVHLRASRPSHSLFDENPGLYFYLSDEEVFAGGGLYEASSRQIKQIRSWLAEDPGDLEALFETKAFRTVFPRGFETKKVLKTFPRGYPREHARIEWLRLQAFYVTQKFSKKEFYSAGFGDLVLENWEQTLRLNALLSEHFTIHDWKRSGRDEALPESMDLDVPAEPELWDDRL